MKAGVVLGMIGAVLSGFASAAPHGPILIDGNAGFTAANGVANPDAPGSATEPFLIQGWVINATNQLSCVQLRNTSAYFVVRNNTCVNARVGIFLDRVINGVIANNSISLVRGESSPANGTYSHGVLVNDAEHITISENNLRDLRGAPGAPVYGIVLWQTPKASVVRNTVTQLYGGVGTAGSHGGDPGGTGGDGGKGGDAVGILVAAHGTFKNISVQGNNVSLIYAGTGGRGGTGGLSGGRGGAGGAGGEARGIFLHGVAEASASSNTVSNLYTGMGGIGGVGGFGGGNGGNGGAGGDAAAMAYGNVQDIFSNQNTVFAIHANSGGNGGLAGFGGSGGRGGDGGRAVGLHCHACTRFSGRDNDINDFAGGAPGVGAEPGGASGGPGVSNAVLSD